ncbi:MAG: hypothetical protein U1F10_10575 [Burkholderiales bacterium]
MLRKLAFVLLLLPLAFGASTAAAQAKKGAAKAPTDKDRSVAITVFMRDPATKNEVLIATRVWPEFPDYNALALGRFFQLMKMMEPPYRQDDDVAYSWQQKGGKITKCSIYLESADAGTKSGTGAVVGCEANGVSSVAVPDAKGAPSGSQDPKHLTEVLEMFKKQQERAKVSAGAK